MQRVCGMFQLDVQCAACSLRLCERLAMQACSQRSNGYTHAIAPMFALSVPRWSAKTRSQLAFLVSYTVS